MQPNCKATGTPEVGALVNVVNVVVHQYSRLQQWTLHCARHLVRKTEPSGGGRAGVDGECSTSRCTPIARSPFM